MGWWPPQLEGYPRTSPDNRRRSFPRSRLEKGFHPVNSKLGVGRECSGPRAIRCCWPPEQLGGVRLAELAELDQFQQLRPLFACARCLLMQGDIVLHRQVREQGEVLKHHANAAPVSGGDALVGV